jgi:formylglycine-generating enzyme
MALRPSQRAGSHAAEMRSLRYNWNAGDTGHTFELVYVEGTNGSPYALGEGTTRAEIEVPAFFIGTAPVTQGLWTHVAGTNSNPAANRGLTLPVENVSWDAITQMGGFLDLINESGLRQEVLAQLPTGRRVFRLPSEAEWEYATRGGPHCGDGFRFSGSNDVDAVAWYDRRHGDHTQPVAQKAPNQLGLYDMSGNVWEWGQDLFNSSGWYSTCRPGRPTRPSGGLFSQLGDPLLCVQALSD